MRRSLLFALGAVLGIAFLGISLRVSQARANCDASYPTVCIPSPPPDLDCRDIQQYKNFPVRQPDPHHFDGDKDGIGCETR
jgi:hypothetical protein